MVDITPSQALLAALQGRFDAARQGQGRGTNSLIPGLPGGGEGTDSGSVIGALGSGGISAGGVPGTATTGSSIANSLIGGGAGAGDPLAQQVSLASGLGFREPGERGDLGAGVTGGDADLLMSILSGNPLLMAAMAAQAVSGQGLSFTGGNQNPTGNPTLAPQGTTIGADGRLIGPGGQPLNPQLGPIRGDSTPGASTGGRSLERERTTGRAVGPV